MDIPVPDRRIARFGMFEADLDRRELTKNGIRVRLQEQPFQILQLLLEKPGEIVTREELQEKLWPGDTFVEFDAGLNTAIKKLRTALGDAADNPLFVETVPRRGYRFVASVRFPEALIPPTTPSLAAEIPGQPTTMSTASGSQTAAGTRMRKRELAWAGAGALVLFVVFGALGLRNSFQPRGTKILHQDTVVLADFVNTTGEPVFGDALKQALSVELGQSPFLNVVSDQKISDTMLSMQRSPNDPLTRELARDVCQRVGSKAIVAGSITSLGSHYVIGLDALGCKDGTTLAVEQAEAPDKESVLKALNKVSSHLRGTLGEALPSVQKFDTPVEATTSSLEALKAYSMGARTMSRQGEVEAIPFFQHAIEMDPNFALAYSSLGALYDNQGETERAEQNFIKAYSLRSRASEREKYHIIANYYSEVTGDTKKERETCDMWVKDYPQDSTAHGWLANVYSILGDREKASTEFKEALRLNPDAAINYGNAAVALTGLDRLDEARAILDTALARGLDGSILHESLYSIAFLRHDDKEMERQVVWATGKPGVEDQILSQHSDTEAYYGHLRKARTLSAQAVASAQRADARETAALWAINAGLREMETGNMALVKPAIRQALSLAPTRDVKALVALMLIRTGDTAQARKLIAELEKTNPENTMMNFQWLPTLKASLEIQAGHPQAAIPLLQTVAPYELGAAVYITNMYPVYTRGLAYLAMHDGKNAAVEFQKMLDHPGIVQNDTPGALSRLQLARAKAMAGDSDGARKDYEAFLLLWKDADPDIPIFLAAQAEYKKLKAISPEPQHPLQP